MVAMVVAKYLSVTRVQCWWQKGDNGSNAGLQAGNKQQTATGRCIVLQMSAKPQCHMLRRTQ